MSKTLVCLYRACFKQLCKLQKIDPIISQHYKQTVSNMKNQRVFKMQKDALNFLQAFANFIQKVNAGDKKSCLKLVRIYCDVSQFCSSQLKINTTFQSKAIKNLDSDIQFIDLNEKDQQFVRKVIKKVCDSKKKPKYKNISIFLNSQNSENFEKKIEENMLRPQFLQHFNGKQSKLQQFFEQMVLEEQNKIRKVLDELFEAGIVVI